MKRVMIVALLGSALALPGGGSKPAEAGSESLDPCDLLSPQDISAITTDEVLSTKTLGNDCHYQSNPEDSEVVLTVYPTGGAEQMQAIHDAGLVLNGIGGAVSGQGDVGQDVAAAIATPTDAAPKLGDEAVWEPNGVLAVRKGDVFVQVTPPILHNMDSHHGLALLGNAEKKKISQAIAEKALAKLAP